MTDMHCPYHCKKSIEKAISIGKKNKVDTVLLNGDSIDFHVVSRFRKKPDAPNLKFEIDTTIGVLKYIRKSFPKAKILFKLGNHELRLSHWLQEHPELYSLECLNIESLLQFKELKIEKIEEETIMQAGKLYIAHGSEISCGGVMPARSVMNKYHCNIAFGHLHYYDNWRVKQFDGSDVQAFSIGALCQLNPDYCPNNNWSNGCMVVEISGNGDYRAQNIRF
jgi:predicted phosphodiesterase